MEAEHGALATWATLVGEHHCEDKLAQTGPPARQDWQKKVAQLRALFEAANLDAHAGERSAQQRFSVALLKLISTKRRNGPIWHLSVPASIK